MHFYYLIEFIRLKKKSNKSELYFLSREFSKIPGYHPNKLILVVIVYTDII